MTTTDAFMGLECLDCGATVDASGAATDVTHTCPDCGGTLDPVYDYDAIDLDRHLLESTRFDSLWRYEDVLPFAREAAVTTEEGATPLVECDKLASELGVARVLIKDESRNPTGTIADREASLAVTAACHHGASDVALSSTGTDGQAVAAYAGRADADLEAHVFVPARSGFGAKAMVNVHGGDMTVAGGRIREAQDAYEDAMAEHDEWYALERFETPYRHEGAKTVLFEIVEQLEWNVPDAIVVPTGEGIGIVGLAKAARELRALGLTGDDEVPALYAAQAAGCAPIVEAFADGREEHDPVEHPDTICGDIEIPDPRASRHVLEAICETDGGAVATEDGDILEAAVAVAKGEGLELSPSAASAASGAWELGDRGEWDGDETIVLVNTASGNKEADVLRSHLMGQGI